MGISFGLFSSFPEYLIGGFVMHFLTFFHPYFMFSSVWCVCKCFSNRCWYSSFVVRDILWKLLRLMFLYSLLMFSIWLSITLNVTKDIINIISSVYFYILNQNIFFYYNYVIYYRSAVSSVLCIFMDIFSL